MPISFCQESAQDVFSHTVQVVIRRRHISVFQGLFAKHLILHLNHLLRPKKKVFFAGLRDNYLGSRSAAHFSPSAPVCCSYSLFYCRVLFSRTWGMLLRLRHPHIRRPDNLATSYSQAACEKWEKSASSREALPRPPVQIPVLRATLQTRGPLRSRLRAFY